MSVGSEDFNPRTHEECDNIQLVDSRKVIYFNPRTHEECDAIITLNAFVIADFNPRTHEECDGLCCRWA